MKNWKNQIVDRGILLDATLPRLQSTRSADDLLLFARSCEEAEQMLELLQAELAKMGLELNWSKTKRLTKYISRPNHNDISFTSIGEHLVQILRSCDSHRILGRDVNLTQQRAQIEVDHRLKVAWGNFTKIAAH